MVTSERSTHSEHFRVRARRRLLAGDNWYLRESPAPSSYTSGSQLHHNQIISGSLTSPAPAPVSIMSDPVKPSSMLPVPVTVPGVVRSQLKEPVRAEVVTSPASRGPSRTCERQISRVRSLSVFSSESHIHREQDIEDDDMSIDFNVLDTVLDEYSQDSD